MNATGVSWIDEGPTPIIACDRLGGQSIVQLAAGAHTLTVLASNLLSVSSLAVWGNEVYWTAAGVECSEEIQDGKGGVFKMTSRSGVIETLASGLTDPTQLWVDAVSVYVASAIGATNDPVVRVLVGATVLPR